MDYGLSKHSGTETLNVLNPSAISNCVPQSVYDPCFTTMMDRYFTISCYNHMCYPGFYQNLQTQPKPSSEKENIQARREEIGPANHSISMPQAYGRNYFIPHQMSTVLDLQELALYRAYSALDYAQYDMRNRQNLAIRIPDSTQSSLEMLAMSEARGQINSSILGEKSAIGCDEIDVLQNNHPDRNIQSNCHLALDRRHFAIKKEAHSKIKDIRDIPGHKIPVCQVKYDSHDQSIKKACNCCNSLSQHLLKNVCDFRPIKTDEDESDIYVERLDDDVSDGTCDDPDETGYIDVVGLSDDERDQQVEN